MADTAVLVIDMLNTYDHEDADALASNVEAIVDPLAALISGARQNSSPPRNASDGHATAH